jgi:hypothetical protein
MSRRNIIITIIAVLLALVALFFLFSWIGSRDEEPGASEGINFFARFNPFARPRPAPVLPGDEIPDGTTGPGEEAPQVRLRRVSSMPVAGYAVFEKERYKEGEEVAEEGAAPTPPATEFAPALRYAARSNGNIYQTFADNIDERRFSNTLVPKVYEALFGSRGESVVMRYLKADARTIETFVATLPKEPLGGDMSQEYEIKGSFLPENISSVALSPDTLKIFYLLPVGEGVAGITAGALGDKKAQVFESPFTEWLPEWPKASLITLTTKPSFDVAGYMYAVNPDKRDLNRVLSGINGLTTLTSPDGKKILYADNNLVLRVYNTESRETISFNPRTLPEKCVWSKSSEAIYCSVPKAAGGANYPDLWYKGETSFVDEIWKLSLPLQNAERISELLTLSGQEQMDNIKLSLDEGEEYLFFVNKKDSYLWELILD